ncbi:MAG: arylsulfatase [Methylococcales bacterium]|nr:arylsulfatase [Methylococcales bacterium]
MNTTNLQQRRLNTVLGLLFTALMLLAFSLANAWAGTPRSTVLPMPEPPFKGKIGRTYKDSQPDKIPIIKAPGGAPNVLVVLIDDAGFGQWSTFGGQIPTPRLDRLAQGGLRYNNFHTTALCSPTRAALLTGRNHHSAGTGTITELSDAYPGYTGQIPKSAAMISEILRQNGYSTAFFGKNHNVPDWETSVSGPYDRWPGLQGFDHFYGFIGGEANQWAPAVYRDHQRVEMEVPKGKEGHYTLNDSLADETINYIFQQKSVTPDRPFFVYYAPGATHAPHHVPKEWLDKFKGQFDQGWDKYREEAYQRQLKLGVIPPNAKLTPRPKEIPAYDSLTPDQKRVAARLMEAFAAYTAQTDYEVGRVLDAVDQIGQLHNTLVFWIIGDNGASMEGTPYGAFNEMAAIGGIAEDPSLLVQNLDKIGGPNAYNHYPVGWAWAMNTPFQWGKQIASHLGGVRNPMVITWPDRIKDRGGIRTQFHHVIDIAPTILEAAKLPIPKEVNGVKQKPIEGVSMLYSFNQADAPSARHVQYFEMLGNRALYKDGWIAAARHGRLPWTMGSYDFDKDQWELYDLTQDFSEADDLAAKYPDKLKKLQDEFWVQAKKYQVLPLDDRLAERGDPRLRPSLIEGRTQFTYYPGSVRIPESSAAPIKNTSHVITAHIEVPQGGADGVLVAEGGVVGGFTLYIKDGRPAYEYNYATQSRYKVAASQPLIAGPNVIRMAFRYDGGGLGKGGTAALFVNAKKVAEGRIEHTAWGRFSADETFDIGQDTGSPVGADYASPNAFTGTLKKVEIDVQPANLSAADQEEVRSMELKASHAME